LERRLAVRWQREIRKSMTNGEHESSDDRYHRELQAGLRDQEAKFDKALLLICGGALTASFAFISDRHTPLSSPSWLVAAWSIWSACLTLILAGFLLSAHAHENAMVRFEQGVRDPHELTQGPGDLIKPANYVAFFLLLVGIFCYARFLLTNVTGGNVIAVGPTQSVNQLQNGSAPVGTSGKPVQGPVEKGATIPRPSPPPQGVPQSPTPATQPAQSPAPVPVKK